MVGHLDLTNYYQNSLPWNESNKFKRYKNILKYLNLYLKQNIKDIQDTRNFHNFLTIYSSNNYKLPNKILLKLKRTMKRCWNKHPYKFG